MIGLHSEPSELDRKNSKMSLTRCLVVASVLSLAALASTVSVVPHGSKSGLSVSSAVAADTSAQAQSTSATPVAPVKSASPGALPANVIVVGPGDQYQTKKGDYVVALHGANVYAEEGAHVDAYDGSFVDAEHGSTVTAYAGSTINAYDGTRVTAEAGSNVVAENAILVTAKPGAHVTIEVE